MSKRAFKSQASSSRAFSGNALLGSGSSFGTASTPSFAQGSGSVLSWVYEPPDLSAISDPAVGVTFKNLQKKDGTTKYKALEELQAYLATQKNNETALADPFLEAWTKLFPRTSIDSSNRVRQLAYTLHGQIVAFSGKRYLKHMGSTVAPWLAGGFDRDRQVARVAKESLITTFSTEDKRKGLWKAFQEPILDYCLNAIQKESVNSLSDERTTSPDDAEEKYARVIGGALLTITGLLEILHEDELRKHIDAYDQCLQSDAIWKLASSKDGIIRKAIYRLAIAATARLPGSVDVPKLGNVLLQQLAHDQSGSVLEFVRALTHFTKIEPLIWTTLYTGSAKKSSTARLGSFLSKGSYGLGTRYYQELSILLQSVPNDVLLADMTSSATSPSKLLSSLRDGITGNSSGRRETELHTQEAWQSYLELGTRILSNIKDAEISQAVTEDALLTIVLHYVEPGLVEWGRNWPDQRDIAAKAFIFAMKYSPKNTLASVERISKALIEIMQTSLPEQSKDFEKSQQAVNADFMRWYDLQAKILQADAKLSDIFTASAADEASNAIELLKARQSKPYGAAKILELLITKVPETSVQQPQLDKKLWDFITEIFPSSMQSPSASIYLSLLGALKSDHETEPILRETMTQLLAAPPSESRSAALRSLVTVYWPSDSQGSERLTRTILDDLELAMNGEVPAWKLPFAALKNQHMSSNLNDQILGTMLQGLSMDDKTEPTLQGLNQLASQDPKALQMFMNSPAGSELLAKLLFLSHQAEESIRGPSSKLRDVLTAVTNGEQDSTIISIIRTNILNTDTTALAISALWTQAEVYLKKLPHDQLSKVAASLMPDINLWREALQPFLNQRIDPSISFMDPFGDAVYLIPAKDVNPASKTPNYDQEGYSLPLRAAVFMVNLLITVKEPFLSVEALAEIHSLLMLISMLISDSIGLTCSVAVYDQSAEHNEVDTVEFLSELRTTIRSVTTGSSQSGSSTLSSTLRSLLQSAENMDGPSFYHARAYVACVQELEEPQYRASELISDPTTLQRLRKGPQHFRDLASMPSGLPIQEITRLFNELVSDFSLSKTADSQGSLVKLITLNILLKNYDLEMDAIPKQRLVYFVKSCVGHFEGTASLALETEILTSLQKVVPVLVDIYDEFWEKILQQIVHALRNQGPAGLPAVYAGLRLLAILERMLQNEPNEDLQDAWSKLEPEVTQSRLEFLQSRTHDATAVGQASQIVYELLFRQLTSSAPEIEPTTLDLYPVLASQSVILHRIAYQILEKSIYKSQEQISLDAALTPDFIPKLPADLLNFLQIPPEEDECYDLKTKSEMPDSVSRYLLSWKLVLSHWNHASYKVRAAYVAGLKDSSCAEAFLNLASRVLIEQYGGKVKTGFDTSRIPSITSYHISNVENPETEFLWLICNIYYNLLLHAPHLAKFWHTNSCPRALKSSFETWTSKHLSPFVIAEELGTVSEWKPPAEDSNAELTIKVYPKASEVTASLPLDETFMSIKVHLPSSYPLTPIALGTVQRVGIDEKKWQAFLNVSLIVMNFSSTSQGLGATIDGISAWRNNVLGALKGHNECAICYSVVAEDGKVPTKKCATCGHLFHGLCLYKWFQRSAGSSCPLCRNAFNYG